MIICFGNQFNGHCVHPWLCSSPRRTHRRVAFSTDDNYLPHLWKTVKAWQSFLCVFRNKLRGWIVYVFFERNINQKKEIRMVLFKEKRMWKCCNILILKILLNNYFKFLRFRLRGVIQGYLIFIFVFDITLGGNNGQGFKRRIGFFDE